MSIRKIYLQTLLVALSSTAIIPQAFAVTGFNVGLDVGQAEAKKFCDNIDDCDNADDSIKAHVGFQFNDNFGLEVGYTSFGTLFDSTDNQFQAKQRSNAVTASGIGTIPIADWFGIFGRVGAAQYSTNSSGNVQGVPVRDEDGTTLFLGAGVNFNLTDHFTLRAEYQNYANISRADGKEDDVQGLYAGAIFKF